MNNLNQKRSLGGAVAPPADPNAPIRIMSVDDHPMMREGLAAMIGTQSDMALIAEAATGQGAIDSYRTYRPDIVLMDLRLLGMGGVEATQAIRKEFPNAKIIVLTTYEGDEDIYRALDAGAQAYLLKEMLGEELLRVIRDVHAGRRNIPPAIAARLAANLPRVELSTRELEVVKLISKGLRNKEIGDQLGIAEPTVKIHVKNLFAKLNVIDRTQAVVVAAQRGFIHFD